MSIHHLDAFRFLFGDPESVTTTVRSNPDSEDDVDEMAVYTLAYPRRPARGRDRQHLRHPRPGNRVAGRRQRGDGAGHGRLDGPPVGEPQHPALHRRRAARRRDRTALDRTLVPGRLLGDDGRGAAGGRRTAAPRASTAATTCGRWRCSRRPTAPPSRGARSRSPRSRSDARRIRLRRRRRGLGRLRGRRPAQRGPGGRGRPGRGRAERLQPGDPRAGAVLGAAEVDPRLGLRERAGTGAERAPHLPAARPRPRRHQLDEHDALRARRGRGLRLLGAGRVRGLVVRGSAAAVQALRGQPARRVPLPRHRRPASGRGPRGSGAAHPLGRRRRRGRPPAQRGLQRRDPGRGRRLPGDAARRAPRAAARPPTSGRISGGRT